jgi:adenine deaminase
MLLLEQYLQAAPKRELHIHLEGAIQPATVFALAQRNNVSLPFETEEEFVNY